MIVHHKCALRLPTSSQDNYRVPTSLLILAYSPDSLLCGRISLCITSEIPKSSSFVGVSLTRSVTSSIKLAWGCGHQERVSNFQPVPKFVVIMPFPFPVFNSTLLFERGTLITLGVVSSSRPRLGVSLSIESIWLIFSVQNFNSSVTS